MSDHENVSDPSSPLPNNDRLDDTGTNWRLECKFVAITWSDCRDDRPDFDSLYNYLSSTVKPRPDYFVLSREIHETTGQPHFHGCLWYRNGIRTRNKRLFDFDGKHPNVQPCREPKNWYDYVQKHGNFRTFGTVPPKLAGSGGDYGDILLKSTSRDDFLERLRSAHPRDFVLFHDRICTFADAHFAKKDDYEAPDVQFLEPESLAQWRRENLEEVSVIDHVHYSRRSLILVS